MYLSNALKNNVFIKQQLNTQCIYGKVIKNVKDHFQTMLRLQKKPEALCNGVFSRRADVTRDTRQRYTAIQRPGTPRSHAARDTGGRPGRCGQLP